MFYKKDGDSILYSGKGHLIFYVPESYFRSKCAIVTGEYIDILGIFNYSIHDANGKRLLNGTKDGIKLFNFPSIMTTQPDSVEKVKDLVLTKNSGKQDYRLLKYKDGDKIIVNTKIPQDIDNASIFFRLFAITGNSPDTIPYDEAYKMYIESLEASGGGSYGISNQLFGILISETYRDPTDKSRPFRLSKAKKDKEWDNYSVISIKDIPNYISPYVSLTSESFDDSIIYATMMKDKNIKSSPLERVLTGN